MGCKNGERGWRARARRWTTLREALEALLRWRMSEMVEDVNHVQMGALATFI